MASGQPNWPYSGSGSYQEGESSRKNHKNRRRKQHDSQEEGSQRHGSRRRWTNQNQSNPKPHDAPPPRNVAQPGVPFGSSDYTSAQNLDFPTVANFPSSSQTRSSFAADFSARRSTRHVSKHHVGRPRTTDPSKRSAMAEEALQQILQCGKNERAFQGVLLNFECRLCGAEDYVFLQRELGNRGDFFKAYNVFEFALPRERRKVEKGKLTSSIISTLGRLNKVRIARDVFETGFNEGYACNVFAFSALISAYGTNGYLNEAMRVFHSMKYYGVVPNLVTYNAVVDACAKGGAEFMQVVSLFKEMEMNGVQPDRITYNSFLCVCSRSGLWEQAMGLFHEMTDRGIEHDIYTYNALLDALSKGGQLDMAAELLSQITHLSPTVVTYSTVIDGFAKAGRFDDAMNLFNEMKRQGIASDRVAYNTMLSSFAKYGKFEEAMEIFKEMLSAGFKEDVVTYNALIDAYGKQCMYEDVYRLRERMRIEGISPNLLTYSTLVDVYSKGGLYHEATEVFVEFKRAGMEADVVIYTSVIDAYGKHGLVQSAISVYDEMTMMGVLPNASTFNSLINAFGRSASRDNAAADAARGIELEVRSLSSRIAEGGVMGRGDTPIMRIFKMVACQVAVQAKNRRWLETVCILGLFRQMHELEIKPNVVTFSAILNACSRCNSFEDASMLLEELGFFDNQVYGVAHRLLMGCRGNVWIQAQSLFDEIELAGPKTKSAFYNALTDVLWHFGQREGAQLVVLEAKKRRVWENMWSDSCLDLHLMSVGAARAMVHAWLLHIRSLVFEGHRLPRSMSILTGWGKHSKVVGAGALRAAIEQLLANIGAPFQLSATNMGRFVSTGHVVADWLVEAGTLELLVLRDVISPPENRRFN